MYYTGVWQWQSGSDYLAHHGILGQKWGKRNGPPYPLGSGDHSASEKKAGWRIQNSRCDITKSNKRSPSANMSTVYKKANKSDGLTDQQKEILKIVGATLGVYGAYKLTSTSAMDRAISIGKDFVDNDFKNFPDMAERFYNMPQAARNTYKSLVDAGFKTIKNPESYHQSLRRINPYFLTRDGQMNCFSCSIACTLRSYFGLDVTAERNPFGVNPYSAVIEMIKNNTTNVISKGSSEGRALWASDGSFASNAQKIILDKFKDDGAQGMCWLYWKSPIPGIPGGGHAFSWAIENGKVKFIDPQRGVENFVERYNFFAKADSNGDFGAVRLDTADFDIDALKKYIKVR